MRAALLFLGLVELPGLLLCLAAGARALTLVELAVLPTALGLLCAPTVALVLMSVGAFDFQHQVAAEALVCLSLAVFVARRRRFSVDVRAQWRSERRELASLGFLILAAVLAVGRPSEWVLAETMDAGNYVIQAAYQAGHPSLFFTDAQPHVYAEDFPGARWRENSVAGTPAEAQRRQLPFPPFFRALLALSLWIGGVPLLLHTPLLLGCVAGLSTYLALRAALQEAWPALLATALFVGAPLVVQFMRVPLAEMCFLLATLTAPALLALARRTHSRAAAGLAGAVLGLSVLIRIDGLLVYAGGALALAAGLVFAAGRGPARAFAASLAAVACSAWALALYATPAYLDHHLRGHAFAVSVGLPIGSLLAAWAALCEGRLRPSIRVAVRLLVIGVAAAALVMLVVQPLGDVRHTLACIAAAASGQPGPGVGHALGSLGCLTLPTVLLGVYGLVVAVVEDHTDVLLGASFFALGAAVFLYAPFHMPDVYWSSRRNLGHVLPLLVLGAGQALRRLLAGRARAWRAAVAVVLALSLIGHNAVITYRNRIDLQGAASSLQALAEHFGPRDAVLVDGGVPLAAALQLGLRYLHAREALAPQLDSLTDAQLAAYWSKLHALGRELHVVTGSPPSGGRLARCFEQRITGLTLAYDNWTHGRKHTVRYDYSSHALLGLRPGCEPPAKSQP